jgi:(1->4)-alpha-D-glucan 1-alpha-D-glucosylmutase
MPPRATYRFQFNKDFPFSAAERLVPYLHALGISHIYASPITTARAGSVHGYDVIDPTQINPELGGDEGLLSLVAALHAHDMGLVVDIVPNHMAASAENAWWVDVLENGRSSRWAPVFDIVWQSSTTEQLDGKVLLPILGDHYGSVLESGQLQLSLGRNGIYVNYWETSLPLAPSTYGAVLSYGRERLRATLANDDAGLAEIEELLVTIDALPSRAAEDEADVRRRQREERDIKRCLWQLYSEHAAVKRHVDEALKRFNGTPGNSRSFDLLDNLLTDQAYRLAYWRVASQEINYRRFFDVADLVAVRSSDEQVFTLTHRRILELAAEGAIDGLRIDHIDGLWDPPGYAQRLRERLLMATSGSRDGYIVVEKILTGEETLREDWPVQGTSGYDYLTDVTGIFVDEQGLPLLDASYRRVTGLALDFHAVAYEQKRRVMGDLFGGDIRGLTLALDRLTALDRHGRDLTQRELGQAIFEVIANFAVYRTYVNAPVVADADGAEIDRAVRAAMERNPYNTRAVEFLRRVLTLDFPPRANQQLKDAWLRFAMRFQQFTGPIMAKGHEDTALYIYNRLVSLNDVGGDPGAGGLNLTQFHARNAHRQARWPHAMLATSTHDTKRSEDVRARINVISELAEAWEARIDQWRRWNERGKAVVSDQIVPDANEEWLIYQTLAGAWPLEDDPARLGSSRAASRRT